MVETGHFSQFTVTAAPETMSAPIVSTGSAASCADSVSIALPVELAIDQIEAQAAINYDPDTMAVGSLVDIVSQGQAESVLLRYDIDIDGLPTTNVNLRVASDDNGALSISVKDNSARVLCDGTEVGVCSSLASIRVVLPGSLPAEGAQARIKAGAVYLSKDTPDVAVSPFEELDVTIVRMEGSESEDNDCDGIVNAFDATPDGLAPPSLIALSANVQRIIEGGAASFSVDARDTNGRLDAVVWNVPEELIISDSGASSTSISVFGDVPGIYELIASVENATGSAQMAFELIVDPEPVLNTPPACGLTASDVSVFTDGTVELNASLNDNESPEADLTNTWLIPGGVIADTLEGLRAHLSFSEPGDYPHLVIHQCL